MCTDFREFDVNDNGQNLSVTFVDGKSLGNTHDKFLTAERVAQQPALIANDCRKWSVSDAITFY